MRRFSQFVEPGVRRALMTGTWGDGVGFVNPDGSLVMVIGNPAGRDFEVRVCVGKREEINTLQVTLPANSVSTFVVAR